MIALAAPLVLLAGGALLACLPVGASRTFRVALPLLGVVSLALALRATLIGHVGGDGSRPLASVAALLGLTLSIACVGDATFGGLGGARLRLARAAPPWMSAAAIAALASAGLAEALSGLAACALLATVAAGSARGSEAALASWRLLRLQVMAVASTLLGALLIRPGDAGPGAGVVVLGVAVLAGLSPFGAAAAAAEAAADAAFAPFVGSLLPFTALVVLLRVRLLLDGGGDGVVDALLLGSGLLSMIVGAAAAWTGGPRPQREATASAGLFGVAVFGFGLGDAGALHAGLVALLAAAFAVPARLLARRFEAGRTGRLSMLASAALPPSGLFAACVLVIDRTASDRPALLVPLLLALGLLLGGLVRRDAAVLPPASRAVRGMLLAHLAIAGVIGLAMPAAVTGRLVDAADRLSGEVSR